MQAVKSLDSLEIIGKLLYNCAVTPKDDKFRRIKLSNKKIAELIVNTPNALDALKAFGWVHDRTNADELVVPSGLYFSMKEVGMLLCNFGYTLDREHALEIHQLSPYGRLCQLISCDFSAIMLSCVMQKQQVLAYCLQQQLMHSI